MKQAAGNHRWSRALRGALCGLLFAAQGVSAQTAGDTPPPAAGSEPPAAGGLTRESLTPLNAPEPQATPNRNTTTATPTKPTTRRGKRARRHRRGHRRHRSKRQSESGAHPTPAAVQRSVFHHVRNWWRTHFGGRTSTHHQRTKEKRP